MNVIKEACVGSLSQAIIAEKNGAHRIELCDRLDLGGTTPSQQLIEECLEHLTIPIKVMIRPRGGNFVYSHAEIQSMIEEVELCNKLGVPEIVSGMLTGKNEIDMEAMLSLSANVGDMPITFHKAIDEVVDFRSAINKLKKIPQVKAILTSGQEATAAQGIKNLKEMISICGDELVVIAAGKVTDLNIETLHHELKAKEYHGKLIVGSLD